MAKREAAVAAAKTAIAEQVEAKLREERTKIVEEEGRRARVAWGNDLELKTKQLAELHELLTARDKKLAEAQQEQAVFKRKERELEEARRELQLTIEKRVQEALGVTQEKARKQVEEEFKLKVMEREQTIAGMSRQIEELRRKADQGSQQLQGEVQELDLEKLLGARFARDLIVPVPKGEYGGDVLQRVNGPMGQGCGSILWECKRTKNWSDSWLAKLRDDQRTAKAEIGIIVSQVLPKGVETFECVESIWVTHPRTVIPLAMALRQTLVEVAGARQASEGMQTKMEIVYQYLTGPRFRQRVQAIAEAFSSMQDDLNSEKKAITKQWAKRQEQIDRVMQATVGMYGDLQGIAGKTLQEIDGLELKALEEGSPPETAFEQDLNL
jgi:hypothetical protein